MTDNTLAESLRNVTDLDQESAEHLRKRFFEEVDIPEELSDDGHGPEPQVGGSDDWTLAFLWLDDNNCINIELLDGSHYIEVWSDAGGNTEPTQHPEDIQDDIDWHIQKIKDDR